jgi:hypothetical protein
MFILLKGAVRRAFLIHSVAGIRPYETLEVIKAHFGLIVSFAGRHLLRLFRIPAIGTAQLRFPA